MIIIIIIIVKKSGKELRMNSDIFFEDDDPFDLEDFDGQHSEGERPLETHQRSQITPLRAHSTTMRPVKHAFPRPAEMGQYSAMYYADRESPYADWSSGGVHPGSIISHSSNEHRMLHKVMESQQKIIGMFDAMSKRMDGIEKAVSCLQECGTPSSNASETSTYKKRIPSLLSVSLCTTWIITVYCLSLITKYMK